MLGGWDGGREYLSTGVLRIQIVQKLHELGQHRLLLAFGRILRSGTRLASVSMPERPRGQPIETICFIDQAPRLLSTGKREALASLARQVMAQLELREEVNEGALEASTDTLPERSTG